MICNLYWRYAYDFLIVFHITFHTYALYKKRFILFIIVLYLYKYV